MFGGFGPQRSVAELEQSEGRNENNNVRKLSENDDVAYNKTQLVLPIGSPQTNVKNANCAQRGPNICSRLQLELVLGPAWAKALSLRMVVQTFVGPFPVRAKDNTRLQQLFA